MYNDEQFFLNIARERGVRLNDVQQEAVRRTEGPLLVLASPGSGKTTTLIMRIGYLIQVQGVSPARIKAVTFSRASASDMKERYKRLFPDLAEPGFSTIHSLAFEVVRRHLQASHMPYRIIEGEAAADADEAAGPDPAAPQKRMLLRQIYQSVVGEKLTDDKLEELLIYIGCIKNRMIPPDRWDEVQTDVKAAARILREYETYKESGTAERLLDFDDMLTICERLFAEDAQLLARYASRYDYVLTDESQDTSAVQHAIIAMLVKRHGNLCVVADDDQSLYSWRGADPAYLLNFKEAYPQAEILYMEQNYRSSAEIVRVSNAFIQRNRSRYPKRMFTHNPEHQPIAMKRLDDYAQQASYLVREIGRLDDLREVAVLYRNNASAVALTDAFDRAAIPYYMKDADNRLLSHWVVEDVLNFMRMTFTDRRPDILEKIHLKMNGYISKQQMAALHRIANDASVFDNLLTQVPLQDYQVKLIEETRDTLREMRGMPPLPAIRVIRERLGYEKALDKSCERMGYRKELLLSVLNMLEMIAEPLPTMEAFASRLKHLEREMRKAKRRRGDQAVTFSTMHSAKGLEFDRVYMIDLVEGMIPSDEDRTSEAMMEEAVRLFYVGMTRARRELELITYAQRDGKQTAESSFMKAVRAIQDPPKRTVDVTVDIQPAKRPIRAALEVKPNPNAVREAGLLTAGIRVKHRVFGVGTVVDRDEEQIRIRFGELERKLLLDVCLGQGLLEIS